jgi:hypothetical protein
MACSSNGQAVVTDVVRLLEAYVRGDRTDTEVFDEARRNPRTAAIATECLRCSCIAQEMLEALGRSPIDPDLPFDGRAPSPTRSGTLRWLERVRDGVESPESLCDWATDAFAWADPDLRMDPVVEEILSELCASEEDVVRWTSEAGRLAILRWHLEHTAAAVSDQVSVALAIGRVLEPLRAALGARIHGESGEDELHARVEELLGDQRDAFPDLVVDLVRSAALLGERELPANGLDAFLECVWQTADPWRFVESG